MHWEKEIRIRLTMRRILGTVLVTSTLVNLAIVGAVLGAESSPAVPTATLELSTALSTVAFFTPTSPAKEVATMAPTPVFTPIPTSTITPTQTSTDKPVSVFCVKRFYWPTYRVQPGDWLSSIGRATGSSIQELMAANCLVNDRIYAGQLLYVPRLPSNTSTPTATASLTPTITATDTSTSTPSSTPTHTPTNTPSSTSTYTPTITPSSTPTFTPTFTPTETPIARASATPTYTSTTRPISTPVYTPTVGLTMVLGAQP